MAELMLSLFSLRGEKIVVMNFILRCTWCSAILFLRLIICSYFYNTKFRMVGQVVSSISGQNNCAASSKLKEECKAQLRQASTEKCARVVFSLQSLIFMTLRSLQQMTVQRSPCLRQRTQSQTAFFASYRSEVSRTMIDRKYLVLLVRSVQFHFKISPWSFLKSMLTNCFFIYYYYIIWFDFLATKIWMGNR